MNHSLKQIFVIARRDFLAVVATPTFLLFLLAPFFMLGVSAASGVGGAYMARSAVGQRQVVAIATPAVQAQLTARDKDIRKRLYSPDYGPTPLKLLAPEPDVGSQLFALFADKTIETVAIMTGPLTAPHIAFNPGEGRDARYLALLAEESLRAERLGDMPDNGLSTAVMTEIERKAPTRSKQQTTGSGTVIVIFVLTLMLASQAVGMMAEEKSNKVLEILAAAVPLEAVFFGKLIGLFGVALIFVSFWTIMAAIGVSILPASVGLASFTPVIGLPLYLILCAAYFTMAYMLLGAVFLGIGAQASTMREIQMLSLPITVLQLAMFGLASASASSPGSGVSLVAQIFPFSSPFAMAARGATDPRIWPHLLALLWQVLWVGLTILAATRLFRAGVLNSGGQISGIFRRKLRN